MPLIPGLGAAIKIGGKALGAIVSKARAKRSEKKTERLKRKAEEKEKSFSAVADKFVEGKETPVKEVEKAVEETVNVSASMFKKYMPYILGSVGLFLLFFLFKPFKR